MGGATNTQSRLGRRLPYDHVVQGEVRAQEGGNMGQKQKCGKFFGEG